MLLGAALCAAVEAAPAGAAIIEVPPLTITALNHTDRPSDVRDAVTIPGTGYSFAPFSAAIARGDVVKLRIQAAPGKVFVLHGAGTLFLNVHWTTGEGGTANCEPSVASFENRSGAVPTETYSCATLGNSRHYVGLEKWYTVPGRMVFTALTVEITADLNLPAVPKDYSNLVSTSFPAIGAFGVPPSPGGPILELVDLMTPVERSSWGRLKALYR